MSSLRRLLPYLRPYRGRAAITALLAAFTAFCAVGNIGAVKPLVDTLFDANENPAFIASLREHGVLANRLADVIGPILTGDRAMALYAIVGFLIALNLLGGIARFFQEYLGGTLAQRIMLDVSCNLQERTVHQSPGFLGGFGIGDAISRFTSDVDSLGTGVRTIFYVLLPEPMKFALSLAVALVVSLKLTLLVVLLFPLSFFLIRWLGRAVKKAGKRVLEKRAIILRQLQDTLFGLPVVQVYGREQDTSTRFRQTTGRVYAYWRKVLRAESATGPAVQMVGVVGGSVAMIFAGNMVIGGELGPGEFGVFCIAILTLYEPVRKLAATVNRLQLAAAGADRVAELMDHVPDIRDREDARPLAPLADAIELESVSYAYPGRDRALDGVSFRIPADATVAVVGASGAGKSTLATLIPRLIDPDSGRVLVDGHDVCAVTLETLRGQIALVPQETILFSDTIAANIGFARPDATREEILGAARAAHVAEFAERLEDGYDTYIGEGGRQLSGGQRQRLALARAMLRDPRILILDEATSALDPESEALIRDSLDRFMANRTAIVIAHHPRALRHADLVIVLDRGRLDCVGSPGACLERSEVYRSFAELGAVVPEAGGKPS